MDSPVWLPPLFLYLRLFISLFLSFFLSFSLSLSLFLPFFLEQVWACSVSFGMALWRRDWHTHTQVRPVRQSLHQELDRAGARRVRRGRRGKQGEAGGGRGRRGRQGEAGDWLECGRPVRKTRGEYQILPVFTMQLSGPLTLPLVWSINLTSSCLEPSGTDLNVIHPFLPSR